MGVARDADTVRGVEIKPIKPKTAYRAALKEIDLLMLARPNTAQGE
ncbi:MAG: hypothetical protein AABY73_05015 [Pseudomonadota bacterium]